MRDLEDLLRRRLLMQCQQDPSKIVKSMKIIVPSYHVSLFGLFSALVGQTIFELPPVGAYSNNAVLLRILSMDCETTELQLLSDMLRTFVYSMRSNAAL